jgi:predicted DNA binding CopG/RHH family protein
MKRNNMRVNKMRNEYDFSKAKLNPYIKKLRKQISIRIDIDTIEYFKRQAYDTGIPYQNLINLYLSNCASHKKTVNILWK